MRRPAAQAARQATWWTLLGVLLSLATVILGSLVGSGELLQPVPILGVRREPGGRRGAVLSDFGVRAVTPRHGTRAVRFSSPPSS